MKGITIRVASAVVLAIGACQTPAGRGRETGMAAPAATEHAELSSAATAEPTAPAARPDPPAQDSHTQAYERAKPWIEDALQIQDAEKRGAAIERIRVALSAADAVDNLAALIALAQVGDVEFDKRSFRAALLPHLDAADPRTRRAAFYALLNVGAEPQDLESFLALAADPSREVRQSASHLIFLANHGDLTGRAGEAVLGLLETNDRRDRREALRGLWGARVSPELEARVLELSRSPDGELQHDAIYFGLSTLADKSPAIVDRLIELLGDANAENSGRSLWGLGQGVPESLQPKVADAMLALFEARSVRKTRMECLRRVGSYGTRDHIAKLEAIVQNLQVDVTQRAIARESIDEIKTRLGE